MKVFAKLAAAVLIASAIGFVAQTIATSLPTPHVVVGRSLPTGVLAPLTVAIQARVAIGDEIGALLGAQMVAVFIGERPGLSSPDSLGVYLTWDPRSG